MGPHHTSHPRVAVHLPWVTAHQILCHARCPVLTVRDLWFVQAKRQPRRRKAYMTEISEQAASRRRVIGADYEETIATTLAIILNQAGFEARAVFSGEQVVKLLDSFQPEMLITDVIMPGMTGIEVAIALRDSLPDCRILLFSGQAATADLLELVKTHGHQFEIVAKPIHPSDLLVKLGVSNIIYS
jgi:CheY-like chemotaxis protein